MIKFLKNIAIFLVLPIIFLVFSDTYLWNKSSSYKEKYNGAIADRQKIEILILGNSHANYGVDPESFESYAFNIANVNQSFYYDKRITLKLIDSLENLKYVFISTDYHSLTLSSQGLRDFWSYQANGIEYKSNNFMLERISPTLFGYPPKVLFSYIKRDIVDIVIYKGEAVNFPVQNGVNLLDTLKQGYIGYTGSELGSFNKSKYFIKANIFNDKVFKKQDSIADVRLDLENFILELKERKIQPILFTTPTFIEYNSYLDSSLLNQIFHIYNDIAKVHNIPFWNFMNSELFGKDCFYDGDHLNKRGARKFGLMLNDSLTNYQKQYKQTKGN